MWTITLPRWLFTHFTKPSHCFGFGLVAMGVLGLGQLVYPRLQPIMHGDSLSYIEFYSHRTALYPAFLDMLGDNVGLAIIAQVVIYLLASFAMFFMLGRARLPISVLLVFLLAIGVNFYGQGYHYTIVTESLGLSITYTMVGYLAMWFRHKQHQPGWYYWLGLAMLAGMLGVALRPNFLPFPFGIALIAGMSLVVGRPPMRVWAKTLAVLVLPVVLVMGFERGYHAAQHQIDGQGLLQKHMAGKAFMLLAMHERHGVDHRFYAGGYGDLQSFTKDFGRYFRHDSDAYQARGEYCMWMHTHAIYESAAYGRMERRLIPTPDYDWIGRVFSAYPITLGRLVGQYYVQSFCVADTRLTSRPLSDYDYINKAIGKNLAVGSQRLLLLLVHWGFLLLGVAFFACKGVHVYRWGKRLLAGRFAGISHSEALAASLALLGFGYILFIAIFGVPVPRLHIPSFPLAVLAILLTMVTSLNEWQRQPAKP